MYVIEVQNNYDRLKLFRMDITHRQKFMYDSMTEYIFSLKISTSRRSKTVVYRRFRWRRE